MTNVFLTVTVGNLGKTNTFVRMFATVKQGALTAFVGGTKFLCYTLEAGHPNKKKVVSEMVENTDCSLCFSCCFVCFLNRDSWLILESNCGLNWMTQLWPVGH